MGARHVRLVGPAWQGETACKDEETMVPTVYAALIAVAALQLPYIPT